MRSTECSEGLGGAGSSEGRAQTCPWRWEAQGDPRVRGAGRGSQELSVPVFSSRVTYTHEAVDSVARLGLTPSFAGWRRLKRPGPSPGVWWGEACTPAGLCRTGGCLHVLTPVPRRRCGRRSPCLVMDSIPRALCWFLPASLEPVNNFAGSRCSASGAPVRRRVLTAWSLGPSRHDTSCASQCQMVTTMEGASCQGGVSAILLITMLYMQ